MKLLILVLCLCAFVLAQNTLKRATVLSHNYARGTINPPCDFRTNKIGGVAVSTPCSNQRGNHLSRLTYSETLQASAQRFANTCPSSHSTFSGGENIYLSFRHKKDLTDNQVVWKAVLRWTEEASSYSPETGKCNGAFCAYFKQLIDTKNKQVGCAINRECGGTKIILVCHYSSAPSSGPQYPVLKWDSALKAKFQTEIVAGINKMRKRKNRRNVGASSGTGNANPGTAVVDLRPVSWSPSLAKKAQLWANSLTSRVKWDNKLTQRIFVHPRKIYASAAYPALCSRSWIKSNQLLGASTAEVGCGQSWHKGSTWVVCYFSSAQSPK